MCPLRKGNTNAEKSNGEKLSPCVAPATTINTISLHGQHSQSRSLLREKKTIWKSIHLLCEKDFANCYTAANHPFNNFKLIK